MAVTGACVAVVGTCTASTGTCTAPMGGSYCGMLTAGAGTGAAIMGTFTLHHLLLQLGKVRHIVAQEEVPDGGIPRIVVEPDDLEVALGAAHVIAFPAQMFTSTTQGLPQPRGLALHWGAPTVAQLNGRGACGQRHLGSTRSLRLLQPTTQRMPLQRV